MPTRDEIFSQVSEVLVDALGVDDSDVTEQATLMGDLGAESIDFLDIVFRLEKIFGVKIPRGDLFPDDIANADASLVANGRLTDAGLDMLRKKMPHADVNQIADDPKVERIYDLFTVGMIVNYMEHRLKA